MFYKQSTMLQFAQGFAVVGSISLCAVLGTALLPTGVQAQDAGGKPDAKSRTAHKKPVQVRTLLLFPADSDSRGAAPLAEYVTEVAKSRLAASDEVEVGVYRSSLASIRRALKEGSLSVKGANGPFDSVSKVQALTKLAGYELAVDGSVDFVYDAAHHQATVSITLSMIDLSGSRTSSRNFADSVTTSENAVKADDDFDAVKPAVRELTQKLIARLLEPPHAPSTPAKTGTGN